MNKKIILRSESFQYPSKEERKFANKLLPKIPRFQFKYYSAFLNFLENGNINNAIVEEDIYWWNNCLHNRLGKLQETYCYVVTHYNRITNLNEGDNPNFNTDSLLFQYYIEIFYYYFFSTRDVLGHLLNHIFKLNVPEDKLYFNFDFVNKITDEEIKIEIINFIKKTDFSYKVYRNAFNHKFTPTQKDNRAKRSISIEENEIGFGDSHVIENKEFVNDINTLVSELYKLMRYLDFKLKKHCTLQL